jgi:hypothetical protein
VGALFKFLKFKEQSNIMAEHQLKRCMEEIKKLTQKLETTKKLFDKYLVNSLYRVCELFPNTEIPLFEVEEDSRRGNFHYTEILNTYEKKINRIGLSAILSDNRDVPWYNEPFSEESIKEYVNGKYTGGRDKDLLAERILEIIFENKLEPRKIRRCYD